jgi:uncharacterized protein YkwD
MRRLLYVVAILATVLAVAPIASSSPAGPTVERRGPLERAVIRELNRTRAVHGLRPLRFGDGLRTAAAQHSRSMLVDGYFEHESADGSSFDQRLKRYYPDRGWQRWAVGEALLSSSVQISAREVVETWIESPPHRAVILSPVYRDGGVGVFYTPAASGAFGGDPALVVTADFGMRER